MNFKTTFVLAIVLIALAGAYLLIPASKETGPIVNSARTAAESPKLIAPALGEVKKIVVSRAGRPDWVFEAAPAAENTSAWKMTAPAEVIVQKYQMDDISRRLKDATVEASYKAGAAGAVTAEQAGLTTPKATVSLTDEAGKTAAVQIGKNLSDHQTYVRLSGRDEILLVSSSLKDLVKEKATDYRDQALLSLKQNMIKKLEIVDRREGAPISYRLVYNGKEWLFEAPFKALAVAREMAIVTQAFSSLRVAEWVDENPKDLSIYGLTTPAVTVSVTTEEPTASQPATTQPSESQPVVMTQTYVFHVSARAPIGDDAKVFVRKADNSAVGTLYKTGVERFYPKINTWRDMRVTTAPVKTATRVELTTPDGSVTFEKKPGGWEFAGAGQHTGEKEVEDLLEAVANLSATAFIDGEVSKPSTFGLDAPRSDIKLSVPEVADVERITIGGYTDPNNKLLVYARRNEANAVAKVRASDVTRLLRPPVAYRDRGIVHVPVADVQRVAISRSAAPAAPPFSFALTRPGGAWTITEPAVTPTDGAAAEGLVNALCELKGSAVVAEGGDPQRYGLDAPGATVELVTQPPASAPASAPATSESSPQTTSIKVVFSKRDDGIYAKRDDRPEVYQVEGALFDKLNAEYHAAGLFTFDQAQVKSVTLKPAEDAAQGLTKDGQTWKYNLEPDLPFDDKKVKNYLVQLKDLKAARYAAYAAADLAVFGLDRPQYELTVTQDDGAQQIMKVSAQGAESGPTAGRYGVMAASHDVFILPPDATTRFAIKPAEFLSDSAPKTN